jgi:phytoene dehydrogenase-like protein
MADYDAIFIGSGHNARSAALCLSQAGWRVLVLKRAAELGGGLRTGELTLPGFKRDLCATNVTRFPVSSVY